MKTYKIIFSTLLFLCGSIRLSSQDTDLEKLLEAEIGETTDYTYGTFLSTYVLNNHSVDLLNRNGINFRFSHKFGFLNSGPESFYGFDHSSVFYDVEYAPLDWINVSIGRSTFRESVNSHLKVRLLRQSKGKVTFPFTVTAYGELDYKTAHFTNDALNSDRAGRLEYTSQLLIARKFDGIFSLQVMPTYIHRNLVETKADLNNIYAMGFGGTLILLDRFRVNAEYFWTQEHNNLTEEFYSPVSLGICYQTSRHSFEIFATNTTGITSNDNIAYTTGNFWKGDICIGFNVSIIFSLKHKTSKV
jgi:hypothetical protein